METLRLRRIQPIWSSGWKDILRSNLLPQVKDGEPRDLSTWATDSQGMRRRSWKGSS